MEGTIAVADHGYLPGPITAYRNTFKLQESPLGSGFSWRTEEISRYLGALAIQAPDAAGLQLEVKAPHFGSFKTLKVTYRKSLDRIHFDVNATDANYYLSKRLGGDFKNLLARGISLSIRKMHKCSTKAPDVGGPCTPALY